VTIVVHVALVLFERIGLRALIERVQIPFVELSVASGSRCCYLRRIFRVHLSNRANVGPLYEAEGEKPTRRQSIGLASSALSEMFLISCTPNLSW